MSIKRINIDRKYVVSLCFTLYLRQVVQALGLNRKQVTNMGILNRSTLMKVHALLAAFILPAAIMFFVTGALYTWGIKGNYDTSTHELHLKKPIQGELDELITLAKKERFR